jgi:voltage-gated potassium channel
MTRNPLAWVGLAGVERDDDVRAFYWQKRLQWPMVGVALLVLLGYGLENSETLLWQRAAEWLDILVFCAFLGETVWMAAVSCHPARYLATNWLNLVILIATFASILDAATNWIALVRVLRVAVSGMLLAHIASRFNILFTRRGGPILVGAALLILLASGAMFYWLEPTAKTYWQGLWLAFSTGTTIGYAEMFPTTGSAKTLAAFTVLIGVGIMALFTANIVSFFVSNDDARLRNDLRRALIDLGTKVDRLLQTETRTVHADIRALYGDLHRDLYHLRRQVAQLVGVDESALVKQLRQEIGELQGDVEFFRAALVKAEARPVPSEAVSQH